MNAVLQSWQVLEEPPHGGACLLCAAEHGEQVDVGLELADGRRVLVCRDCGERIARGLKIATRAAEAALAEAAAEKTELERQVADGALERERLAQQVEELRERLNASDFLWRQLGEHTAALHALAQRGWE